MTRLRKFVERGVYGEGLGRNAYVHDPAKLPEPVHGFDWRSDSNFKPGDALLADAEDEGRRTATTYSYTNSITH